MKRFIDTIKHIWKIEELRNKILITLGFIAVYRFGSFVVLPGIDAEALNQYTAQAQKGLQGLIDIFDSFFKTTRKKIVVLAECSIQKLCLKLVHK